MAGIVCKHLKVNRFHHGQMMFLHSYVLCSLLLFWFLTMDYITDFLQQIYLTVIQLI